MENKSSNENKVLCRKCGGPHFTIKCGKEKKEEPVKIELENDVKQNNNESKKEPYEKKSYGDKPYEKKSYGDKPYEKKSYGDKPHGDRKYFKVTYRVKLSELPTNMSEEELMELTTDWGHIVRIKLLIYEESSTAYIDFGYEDEAEYFVEAINKTPFEHRMLASCRVESYRNDNDRNKEAHTDRNKEATK